MKTKTLDLGNNEQASYGIFKDSDGTFTALTLSKSKSGFKTEKAATKWLVRTAPSLANKLGL